MRNAVVSGRLILSYPVAEFIFTIHLLNTSCLHLFFLGGSAVDSFTGLDSLNAFPVKVCFGIF